MDKHEVKILNRILVVEAPCIKEGGKYIDGPLNQFYRDLGWNPDTHVLDPGKVFTTKQVHDSIYDAMEKICPDPVSVGMTLVNWGPSTVTTIKENTVHLHNGWLTEISPEDFSTVVSFCYTQLTKLISRMRLLDTYHFYLDHEEGKLDKKFIITYQPVLDKDFYFIISDNGEQPLAFFDAIIEDFGNCEALISNYLYDFGVDEVFIPANIGSELESLGTVVYTAEKNFGE